MSTEIAVRSSTELASIEELERILLDPMEPIVAGSDDPDEISREILAQLLGASSDAELESFGEAEGWRDYAVPRSVALAGKGGTAFEIRGFKWRPSSFEEGQRIFFVVQAIQLDTGELKTLTTGSGNVMAQLANMAKRETLVGAVRMLVTADKETSRGFKPLWLVTPPGYGQDEAA